MLTKPSTKIITLLCITFAIEGTGILGNGLPTLLIILVLPLLLILRSSVNNEKINFDKKGILLFAIFLLFSTLSVVFSLDIKNSVPDLFLYIALFVIFTYSYRYKNEVKKLLIPIIFTFSYLLSIYSILLPQLKSTGFSHLIPIHGYQLIYPSFGSHNHLGDFLILPLAICFYKIILRKGSNMYFYFLSILFFLPYFIFSFSRSAYLSLVLIVILIVFHQIKSNNISLSISRFATILLSLGLSIILLLSLSQVNLGPFKGVANTISNKHQLNLRDPLGYRDKYLNQGIQSISKRPFFGVGPSNFIHASKEYSTQNLRETYTAHNIFIEIVVENGIFAGLIFILIILLCIKNAKKDIYFFLGLALLINFQTDYTYLIYPMLILFVILLGVSYSENENRISNE